MHKVIFRLLTTALVLLAVPAFAQNPGQAPGGTVYGNRAATQGQPGYTAVPVLGIPGSVLGRLGLAGSTSGTVTITPQAIAGTPLLTLPNASGTFAISASSPLVLSATTGGLTCPTCLANSPAALTKTDDTNVTLTLGGSPSIALLNATSLTLGWTSQLSLARGGTGSNLTASNGGLVYSTASGFAILAGTATANQIPLSGSSVAPSWSTATYPGTAAAGTILAAGSANVIAGTATPTLGANGGTGGQITLNGSTSGGAVIKVAAAAGTTNFQLPVGNGTNGFALTTNGSGVTAWSATGTGTVTSITCDGGVTTITTSGTCASREVLAADRTYYVRTDGNDSNTCQVNNAGGACLTRQGAWNKMLGVDWNNHVATMQIGAGTYTGAFEISNCLIGPAQINITGDTVTPSNVLISVTSDDAFRVDGCSQPVRIAGFKTVTISGGNHFNLKNHSTVYFTGAMDFGASASSHVQADSSNAIFFSNYTISGSTVADHHHAIGNGNIGADGLTITLTGTPAFGGAFMGAAGDSTASYTGVTFSGSGTGTRYNIHGSSFVKTASGSPSTFFPGNVAGTSDGGNLDDDTGGGAWLAWTSTPTPAGGAFTATLDGAYKLVNGSGGKTVLFRGLINISSAGTGTGSISVAAPIGNSQGYSSFLAREISVTGFTGSGFIVNGTSSLTGIAKYDATTLIAGGANIVISGQYQRQ